MLMPGLMPGPPGAGWVGDGGGSNGAALARPTPNISGEMATPAAIAAALAARLRFIGFRFPRGLLTSLVSGYPRNAQTNPATPPNDVAIGLTTGRYGVGPHAPRLEKTRALSSAALAVRQRGTAAGIPASPPRPGGFPRRCAHISSISRRGCPAGARPDRVGGRGPTGVGSTRWR